MLSVILRGVAPLAVIVASVVRADDPPPPPPAVAPGPLAPAGYPSVDDVRARLREIAKAAGARGSVAQIATSREGRAIDVLTLGDQDLAKKQPAMLLVAGMDGVNLGSTEQLLAAIEATLRDNAKALDGMRVYAIAQANPDARAWAMANKRPRATNARVVDDDRDGASDEDAPRDLNGDGLVTLIRRVAPPGSGATHVVDAVDPRIVRGANKEKREVATHEVFVEGDDADRDGVVAEDATGGVDLDRNFSHRWPEFAADAGPYQLSEPEALGIAEFVRKHPDITTAVVFGRHDTLVNFPDTKDKDSTGRTPVAYLAEDHDLYRDFGKAWKESTKIEKSDGADLAGSLVLWLADHRGIAAVAANGWTRPEVPKPPEPPKDEPKEGEPKPEAPRPEATKETGDGEQSAWLALSEKVYSAGFAPWTAFKHPVYGDCEIGGFVPFFRESPTLAQARDLGARTAPFIAALAAKRSAIDASEPKFTALADGLAKIEFRVVNSGTMATTTEMGRITGVVPPVIVRLIDPSTGKGLSPEAVLSGQPVNKLARVAAAEAREFTWIVRLPAGGAVQIATSGPTFDTITRTAKGASK
jgi:Zinc carboxypeptidase